MIPSRSVGGLALLVVAMALAGCGATRSSPDNPLSAGGLTPSLEDKEAGLVAVAPGFAVKDLTWMLTHAPSQTLILNPGPAGQPNAAAKAPAAGRRRLRPT